MDLRHETQFFSVDNDIKPHISPLYKKDSTMIETDRQRRWWFANHPQFSEGRTERKGTRNQKEAHRTPSYSPKDVDAYVDERLKHADGSHADLLKSIKRNFGSKGDSEAKSRGNEIRSGC